MTKKTLNKIPLEEIKVGTRLYSEVSRVYGEISKVCTESKTVSILWSLPNIGLTEVSVDHCKLTSVTIFNK